MSSSWLGQGAERRGIEPGHRNQMVNISWTFFFECAGPGGPNKAGKLGACVNFDWIQFAPAHSGPATCKTYFFYFYFLHFFWLISILNILIGRNMH